MSLWRNGKVTKTVSLCQEAITERKTRAEDVGTPELPGPFPQPHQAKVSLVVRNEHKPNPKKSRRQEPQRPEPGLPTITQFPALVYTWQESLRRSIFQNISIMLSITSLSASSSSPLKAKHGKSLAFSAVKKGVNGTQRSSPASESSGLPHSWCTLWIFSPVCLTYLIMIPDPSLLPLADLLTPPFLAVLQQIVTWLSTPPSDRPLDFSSWVMVSLGCPSLQKTSVTWDSLCLCFSSEAFSLYLPESILITWSPLPAFNRV